MLNDVGIYDLRSPSPLALASSSVAAWPLVLLGIAGTMAVIDQNHRMSGGVPAEASSYMRPISLANAGLALQAWLGHKNIQHTACTDVARTASANAIAAAALMGAPIQTNSGDCGRLAIIPVAGADCEVSLSKRKPRRGLEGARDGVS